MLTINSLNVGTVSRPQRVPWFLIAGRAYLILRRATAFLEVLRILKTEEDT